MENLKHTIVAGLAVTMIASLAAAQGTAIKSALADNVSSNVVDSNDGLIGQVLKTKKVMEVFDVPADCFTVITGLGNTTSIHLYILPIVRDNEVCGVIEATSFVKLAIVDVWEDIQGLLLA